MSHKALQWALGVTAEGNLPPAAALLLIVLADHHNPEKGCFPSQKTLSKRTGMTSRWVRKCLRILAAQGLVRTVCRGRRNAYTLLMAPPNSGTIVPQSEGKLDKNTVPIVPVYSGTIVPQLDKNTGPIVPLVLTSKEDSSLTSNLTVEFASQIDPTKPGDETGDSEEKKIPEPTQSFVKEEPMDSLSVVKKAMTPKTEEEILARVEADRAKPAGITGATLGRYWRDLQALHLPLIALPEITLTERRQLSQAYKLAGEEFFPALACALKQWPSFVAYVSGHGGFIKPSEKYGMVIPNTVALLKYVQVLVVFYREQVQLTAQPDPVKKPKPLKPAKQVKQVKPAPSEAPATLEDIEAIFSGSKSGQ